MAKKLSIPEMRVTSEAQQGIFAEAADPLVSLKDVDVKEATLLELADIVQAAHISFQSHLADALQAAIIAGRALVVAKEKFAYDPQTKGFRGWLEEIKISKSSAYRYIQLATNELLVSQAGTLSEALDLLAKHRAEQRVLKGAAKEVVIKKRRVTLKLTEERDQKLEQIAKDRGIEVAVLTTEILEKWLSSQEDS